MTEAAVERRIVRVPPTVAFGSKFGKYTPEEEKDVRKVDVKEDEVLRQLKAAWRNYKRNKIHYEQKIYFQTYGYEDALRAVKGISYSAADVERFSLALVEFQDEEDFSEKAGFFLSALINNGKDTDYVIHTRHLTKEIDCLGFENTKNITVEGDVGCRIGYFMGGGAITVNGDTTNWTGSCMRGGMILVSGDACNWVGDEMKGGKIYIKGDYLNLGRDIEGGKIYHKGVLIVDK